MLQNYFLPGETKRSSSGLNKMLLAVIAAIALLLPLGISQPALAASTVTINYDASPGEFSPGDSSDSQVVNIPGSNAIDVDVPVPSTAPTRMGYTFTGWYDGMTLKASPTDTTINVTGPKNSTITLNLTAGWEAVMVESDYVTFNANFDLDYTSNMGDTEDEVEVIGGSVDRPTDPVHPSMETEFTFAGWATYEAGMPVLVTWVDDKFETEESVTLFAVWDFDSNLDLTGGIEVATDATFMTLSAVLGTITTPAFEDVSRIGYQLAGYQIDETGACTSAAYNADTNTLPLFLPGAEIDIRSEAVDLVACWFEGVTYSANNVDEPGTRGATYTQPATGDPAKDIVLRLDQILAEYSGPDSDWYGAPGYEIFVDWANQYKDTGGNFGCNGADYMPGEPLPNVGGDRLIYACWEALPEGDVLIQYNLNDGTYADMVPPQSVEPDTTLTLPPVEKPGSEFLGWVEGTTCDDPMIDREVTVTEENHIFTACFDAETYIITLVDQEGTGSGSTTEEANYGDSIALDPETASGYSFVKWVSGTDCEADAVTSTGAISADATFTACWEEVVSFTITLVDKSGTGSGSTTVEVNDGDSYALTTQSATGYVFVKWVSGTSCAASAVTTTGAVTADATFKACWTASTGGGGGGGGGGGTTTPISPLGSVPLGVGVGPFVSGLAAGTYSFIAVPPIKSWVLNVNNGAQNLQVRGLTASGKVRNMNTLNQIILRQDSKINVIGSGYLPNSKVLLFMFSPANSMGELTTSSTGTFNTSFALPAGMKLGLHHVQVTGYNTSSNVVAVSTPVWFAERTMIVARSVYFNPDSAVLTAEAKAALERLAARVKASKARSIQVSSEGYVYPVPDTSVYQSLSRARARAVVAYLRSLGVKATSFTAVGRGAAKLEQPTSRRAEILVTGTLVGE